jgi:hypothetical protein
MSGKIAFTINVLLFHSKVMPARFDVNSHLIQNEAAEKPLTDEWDNMFH